MRWMNPVARDYFVASLVAINPHAGWPRVNSLESHRDSWQRAGRRQKRMEIRGAALCMWIKSEE